MGMTIKPMSDKEIVENLKTMVFGVQAFERFNAKERETLDKAWNLIDQYESRLKADMVAMLTEIQLEIDEMPMHYDPRDVSNLIQQKINALKADRSEEFHCGFEESGGHAYNCNDCPNKCDEWYQWDKEMKTK